MVVASSHGTCPENTATWMKCYVTAGSFIRHNNPFGTRTKIEALRHMGRKESRTHDSDTVTGDAGYCDRV
jgi:hypothetical protein